MRTLGVEIKKLVKQISPDVEKLLYIARVKDAYVQAVKRTWKGNPHAVIFLLEHTNAVYVRKDDRPRKGALKDKPYILCDICVDDATARSEINARAEVLKLSLNYEGITFDEMRIIPAKMGMRNRHPFKELVEDKHFAAELPNAQIDRGALERKNSAEMQETFKRAMFLALGFEGASFIDMVNRVEFEEAQRKDGSYGRDGYRSYRVRVYTNDVRLKQLMADRGAEMVARARELKLYIRSIDVHCGDRGQRLG